jgi:hypothetical protein
MLKIGELLIAKSFLRPTHARLQRPHPGGAAEVLQAGA